MNIWQGKVLAIHVTEKCNFKCSYCYLTSERQNNIRYEYIEEAVKKIKPDTLFLYGGEPLLCKDLVIKIIESYPNKNIIFETNGSLLTEKFMEYIVSKNVGVIISLDSYSYELNCLGRPMSRDGFQQLLKIIIENREYKRLNLMCSIDRKTSDFAAFCNISKGLGIKFEQYLIVGDQLCNITETPFYLEYKKYPDDIKKIMAQWHKKPNINPKLRLHCNGMVSRTLNYDEKYAICYVADWEDTKIDLGKLPYPKSCEHCLAYNYCNLLGTFPHWAYELEQKGVLHQTFACQASKLIAEEVMMKQGLHKREQVF